MRITRWKDSVVKCEIDSKKVSILWLNDLHMDSIATDRNKVRKLIEDNAESYIVVSGDMFDVMQNTGDRRASKGALKQEYNKPGYLNSIIEDLVSFFKPYANRIVGFNYGNHETAQLKFHGIDLTRWIVSNLNRECGTEIAVNDFQGYYIFQLLSHGKRTYNYFISYSHKPISGGGRSKGMLSVDLISGRNPSADMYIAEHIHQTFATPISVEEIDISNKQLYYREKWYVQAPTMKAEHEGEKQGHHFERNYGHTWNGVIEIVIEVCRKSDPTQSRYIRATPKYIRI